MIVRLRLRFFFVWVWWLFRCLNFLKMIFCLFGGMFGFWF